MRKNRLKVDITKPMRHFFCECCNVVVERKQNQLNCKPNQTETESKTDEYQHADFGQFKILPGSWKIVPEIHSLDSGQEQNKPDEQKQNDLAKALHLEGRHCNEIEDVCPGDLSFEIEMQILQLITCS